MTILEEELTAALREVTDASPAMVAALERHEEPNHKISDRYDDALDWARMVLVRAGKME